MAINGLPTICHVDSQRHLKCNWPIGIVTNLLKAKNIYNILDCNTDIIDHVNVVWYSSYDADVWEKNTLISSGRIVLSLKLDALDV